MRGLLLLIMTVLTACSTQPTLPQHPSQLSYPELALAIPDAAPYRHQLSSGDIVYFVPDPGLPLVEIAISSRAGRFMEPPGQAGLASLTATMLRDGGTTELSPAEMDERLEFLATGISFQVGNISATASLDSLTSELDASLVLLGDMLVSGRFDEARFLVNRNKLLERMRERNDDTSTIESHYWQRILYGEENFLNQRATRSSVDQLSTANLRDFAQSLFPRGQLLIAASGDVEPAMLLQKLERLVARLPERPPMAAVPKAISPWAPGLYLVNKDDVNQSRVTIGHVGGMKGDAEELQVKAMNRILGGGGFVSRITSRVRSDEGLAYTARSAFGFGRHLPGTFSTYFQSKNGTVTQAAEICLEEIARIQKQPVTVQELETTKQATTALLHNRFSSPMGRAQRFVSDLLDRRTAGHWQAYPERVSALSAEDLLQAAKNNLHLDQLRVLVVGKIDEVDVAGLERLVGHSAKRLPLLDPMTLQPMDL